MAFVSGDDGPRIGRARSQREFVNLDTGEVLPPGGPVATADAYLRAARSPTRWRRSAVVVMGPVPMPPRWSGGPCTPSAEPDGDLDAIAGRWWRARHRMRRAARWAGSVAFFEEVPKREHSASPWPSCTRTPRRDDGGAGTGDMVRVGTVTAECLTRFGGPRFLARRGGAVRHDRAAQEAPTARSRPAGGGAARDAEGHGQPGPGWRDAMTLASTGAQVAEKAWSAAAAVWPVPGAGRLLETAEASRAT